MTTRIGGLKGPNQESFFQTQSRKGKCERMETILKSPAI